MRNAISRMMDTLQTQFGFVAAFGFELEWYVIPAEREGEIDALHKVVLAQASRLKLGIPAIVPEKGRGQYEAAFNPRQDPFALIEAVHLFKRILRDAADGFGLMVTFAAKPFQEDYGSALQSHISLTNLEGVRQFEKKGENLSPPLSAALGGLLETLDEAMLIAAPYPASYTRFTAGKDAPLTRSWGGNNRTVALRLPLKNGPFTQIEYRIAGADADPTALVAVMLAGVLHGLTTNPDPGPQMHGVAYDPQYKMPRLPDCYAAAKLAADNGVILRKWLVE